MTVINNKLTMFPSPYNNYLESARTPVYETPEKGLAAISKHSARIYRIYNKMKTESQNVAQMQGEYFKTMEMKKNQSVEHSINKQVQSIGMREYMRITNNFQPPSTPNMGGIFNGIA